MLATTMPLVMLAVMSAMAREAPVGRFDQHGFVAYYLATLLVRQMTGAWVAWEMVQEIKEGTLGAAPVASDPSARQLQRRFAGGDADARRRRRCPSRSASSSRPAARTCRTIRSSIAIFVASIGGAWLLNFAVSATIGTLGLFIESSLQVWELWLGGFMLLSGYLIPLSLFPPWLEKTARVLPFAYLQAFPVETLTGLRDRHHALVGLGVAAGVGRGGVAPPPVLVEARAQALRGVRRLMRYLRLFAVQLRASLQVTMQYRAEFFVGLFMAAFWVFWNVVPMFVLWTQRLDDRRLVARGGGAGDRVVHLLARDPRRRGAAVAAGGGRAHPQRHARLRAAQAGRRAVPGVDGEVRGLQSRRRDRGRGAGGVGACIDCIACRAARRSRSRWC